MKVVLLLLLACAHEPEDQARRIAAEPGTPAAATTEDCDNAADDDADGLVDCADPDCPPCPELCHNGRDDDADGLLDCADPDCSATCAEQCTSGQDDDLDGLIDCHDPDCTSLCAESCTNGLDDDADGAVDCDDAECEFECDNDGDGFRSAEYGGHDCDDGDPWVSPFAPDHCEDGVDQDCDGVDTICIPNRPDTGPQDTGVDTGTIDSGDSGTRFTDDSF